MRSRRRFLLQSITLSSAPFIVRGNGQKAHKVGVLGHTGRGNFGHGLDSVWKLHPQTTITGIADAEPNGLKRAQAKLKEGKAYADYREMLDKERPYFVAVCPRHVDQRVPMIKAACEFGAKGIYVEKPFARSLEACDLIEKACKKSGTKLAVAHRNRYHPALGIAKKLITEGLLGKVVALRGRGKEDHRGGAEDLWVLGTHVFDLVHSLAGNPLTCSAEIRKEGKLIGKKDVIEGNEGLGPLAGDEVRARWRMENGWTATFDSIKEHGTRAAGFGLQVIGNEGILDVRCDKEPLFYFLKGSPWDPRSKRGEWIPLTSGGLGKQEPADVKGTVHNHLSAIRDLVDCVERDGQPKCGLEEGTSTVSFVSSVFESHRLGSKSVTFPLKTRKNPLGLL
jgi:predicted dehydrogenase